MKKQIVILIAVEALITTVLSECGDQITAEVNRYDYEPVSSYDEASSTEQDASWTVTEIKSSEMISSKMSSKTPRKPTEKIFYKQIWIVPRQWKFTTDKVKRREFCNRFDKAGEYNDCVIITYLYKKLGYTGKYTRLIFP